MKIYKIANDNRGIILQAAQYILNIIQNALSQSQNAQTPDNLRNKIYEIAKQNGLVSTNSIRLPKNIDPNQKLNIKIYPKSADGKTHAEVQEDTIRLYTDIMLIDPKNTIQNLYGTLIHELAHVFEKEGTSPDEEIENAGERTVRYLINDGEMNSFAWQIAAIYSKMFHNEQFDNTKLSQLAQQYQNDNRIQAYLVKFPSREIQQKYANVADLAQIYTSMIGKIQYYITYILQQNQKQLNKGQYEN